MVGEISSKIEGLDLNARCLRMFISFEIIRQCALIILRLVLGTLHRPKVRNAYNAIDDSFNLTERIPMEYELICPISTLSLIIFLLKPA